MRFRTHCLRKGTLLYHGTSAKEIFEEGGFAPNGPAWFSTSKDVAEHFIGWHKGPCPRVLVYRVMRNIPKLPTILSKDDMDALLWGKAAISSEDMADFVCNFRNFTGWYIPYNYPQSDDIMLCSTDALEFVERICLEE